MSRDDIRAIVQWMINNHYMFKTKARYPVLHPTYDGNHFDEFITKKQIKYLISIWKTLTEKHLKKRIQKTRKVVVGDCYEWRFKLRKRKYGRLILE